MSLKCFKITEIVLKFKTPALRESLKSIKQVDMSTYIKGVIVRINSSLTFSSESMMKTSILVVSTCLIFGVRLADTIADIMLSKTIISI